MKDWLNDPLQRYVKSEGSFRGRRPKKRRIEPHWWWQFHVATRAKLEGAAYFCQRLAGAGSLPLIVGLPGLNRSERRWYADAFFFLLFSAYDTLLQELNVIYEGGMERDKVRWQNARAKNDIKRVLDAKARHLSETMEATANQDWFNRLKWYRNFATHHNVIRTDEGTTGWGEETWEQRVSEVELVYFDDGQRRTERLDACEGYLRNMTSHIKDVWGEMRAEFK